MENQHIVNNFVPFIIELETDYEVVYKEYIEPIERIGDVSSSVAIVVGEPAMKRGIELYSRDDESHDKSDDEYKKRINMAPLFDEDEIKIIQYAGLFGIYFFSIFIVMHF